MATEIVALGIFVVAFAVAAVRNVNIGIVVFPLAAAVGLWWADLSLEQVVLGFPISILVLLVGVTYFFGIAHSNGTVDWLIEASISRVGSRDALFPAVFFALTAGVSAMGAPLGGLVMAPVGMSVAKRRGIDPMLMALAMGTGLAAGAFAPTSLFGIITWGTADEAGIELNPLLLFVTALVVNLVLLGVAYAVFGRASRRRQALPVPAHSVAASRGSAVSESGQTTLVLDGGPSAVGGDLGDHRAGRPDGLQLTTLAFMLALVTLVVVLSLSGREPDIGILSFSFGAVLALLDPAAGKRAMSRIDWGSVLLVGGIITYVGVLSSMGVIDLLGEKAADLGSPLVAAFLLCAVAGLISAFASTTGMLAALVPLALPLIADGGIPGWALICAIGICASIVDVSPFSTVGATYVATAEEEDRPRLTRLLTRWGLSMVAVGPLVLVSVLVVPGMVLA